MKDRAFQDYYAEDYSHCYGCGRLNKDGLHIQSYWNGEESIAKFKPKDHHIAVPGFVYGGIIASLIDCHGTATAAAAAYLHQGRSMDTEPKLRFVTASLKVDYRLPTPLGIELEARGKIKTITDRKVTVEVDIVADGKICAHGEVIAVSIPDTMK